MTDLTEAVRLLQAKRDELQEQLKAVETALEALGGLAFAPPPPAGETPEPAGETPGTSAGEVDADDADAGIVATRLKARKTLSDDHRHALKEGRRKARHTLAVAAGLARELPAGSSGLPSGGRDPKPKLVKRPR
jgi:hypothetical protein